ncbi:hypothetical protein JTE90_000778 [Oedothorax gibbosus]|uniref:Uncharacterized protein n=1 Tax=Oedothorax gibbosus TaxID=931172 RepID=A0AAV6U9X9_9ARAC|nr:hypothetical protein JTE90_000778 [Oedothorax gibbosus]
MFGRKQDTNKVAGDCAKRRPGLAKRRYKRRKRESVPSFSQVDESVTMMDHLWMDRQHINHSMEPIAPVWQFTDGENFDPYSANGFRENRLPSTQRWRNLRMFNNGTQDDPLLISEEIFRENVNDLLNGIDECAENPAQWSRDRTNSYFDKIQRFLDSWKRQLMKEDEKMDLEVLLVKRKFENKHDSVTNRLNILTGVLRESMCFMEFSEFQKRNMQSKVEDLNHVRSSVGERGHLVLSESSLAIELKTANEELIEARRQADEYCEELRQLRDNLKEANLKLNELTHAKNLRTQVDQQVMLDKCLQDKEQELKELKKQIDKGAEKQTNTETELVRTREQFQSFALKSLEINQTKQMESNKMLYEIQTSLCKKNPEYKPMCQSENESLSQEKLFKDITALIENDLQWVSRDNNCKKNTTEIALDSGSMSLRVSEYELHLVTLISSFLKVTPFPVKSSYIHSYVANIDNVVDLEFVENLLRKLPSLFKEVAVVPGSVDKNWTYLDLKPVITI